MTDRHISLASLAVACLAFALSILAFLQSRAQYLADYEDEVTLKINQWPLNPISIDKPSQLSVEVRNTSKRNLEYVLRLSGNAVCVSETEELDLIKPCRYESRPVRISKPEAGSHVHVHTLFVRALPGAVNVSSFAYASDPNYFVTLEVANARNGTPIYKTTCYYTYQVDAKALSVYMPLIDTSDQSKTLQAKCM